VSNSAPSLLRRLPIRLWLMLIGLGCLFLGAPSMGICGPTSGLGAFFLLAGFLLLGAGALLSFVWGTLKAIEWAQRFLP